MSPSARTRQERHAGIPQDRAASALTSRCRLKRSPRKKRRPRLRLTKSGKPRKRPAKPKRKDSGAARQCPRRRGPLTLTLADALHYLSLPRELGNNPESGKPVIANVGRFGPYIGHDGEFRSLKGADDPYTITLDRALVLLAEPKRPPKGVDLVRELGKHPKDRQGPHAV